MRRYFLNIAFITHFCPHYRVKTFEKLAEHYSLDYYFFSQGEEWYWLPDHGVKSGGFNYKYLTGFTIAGTRINPSLITELMKGDYDVFVKCINGRFALPVTYLISRLKNKPFILWTGVWMRLDTFFHRLFFPITKYIYKKADAIVVYGSHVKKYLMDEGISGDKIFGTVHSVDNQWYSRKVEKDEIDELKNQLGISQNKKVILYLGRLEKSKGLSFLLKAFALIDLTNVCLVLAGKGSEKQDLESQAKRLGVRERVRFPGYIPINATVPYYAMADVFVLPSITTNLFKEPWGLVINEAFNQGCPVIATESVGAAAGGLVKDEENGFIVPEGDIHLLSSALTKVICDDSLKSKLSSNAKLEIKNWTNSQMVDGFCRAIDYVGRDI